MKPRKKTRLLSCVALLLAFVTLLFGILFKDHNGGAKVIVQTRTIELSAMPSRENYLNDFREKSLDYDDNSVVFHGVMNYDERVLPLFDRVALSEQADLEKSDIVYECSFDLDTMLFTFRAILLDENRNPLETEEQTTKAFVSKTGRLDAYIELNGETYLLSDYVSQKAIEDCFFGWLFSLVVVIVIYVVVAETAEQIKAKQNYKNNQKLENDGDGVDFGNYITNQHEVMRTGYKSGKYAFGFTEFSNVGCEVASVYNLLIAKNSAERLSETIYNFEKWAIEFSISWGTLGSNPKEIYRYLNKKSIKYEKYTSFDSLKSALNAKKSCHVIMSSWNDGGVLKSIFGGDGLHTYYLKKLDGQELWVYNFDPDNAPIFCASIDKLYSKTGNLIAAYVIN